MDLIDVSAGQTTVDAKPIYGRMFQTPFSDRIKNDGGLTTMAVGNIYEADHANSILMAGRGPFAMVARICLILIGHCMRLQRLATVSLGIGQNHILQVAISFGDSQTEKPKWRKYEPFFQTYRGDRRWDWRGCRDSMPSRGEGAKVTIMGRTEEA